LNVNIQFIEIWNKMIFEKNPLPELLDCNPDMILRQNFNSDSK